MHTSKTVIFAVLFLIAAAAGFVVVSWANGGVINACVNKNGTIYLIGYGRHDDCDRGDTPISWNIQGPPGPAVQGAGNVAFFDFNGNIIYALTNNGQAWRRARPQWIREDEVDPPMPVAEIVRWERTAILDTTGDLWLFHGGEWSNVGHP